MTTSANGGDDIQGDGVATFRLDDLISSRPIAPDEPDRAEAIEPDSVERGMGARPILSGWSQARLALAAFVLLELVALVALFVRLGDSQWFRMGADDWDFLSTRDLGSASSLLDPHFGHWVTLPVVVYRILFAIAGFDYRPYLLALIVVHLAVVALLRVIMRRVGVGPWIATAVAASLLLFGSGRDDIVWAFQITFTAAAMFGLIHLILSDHDGRLGRRDWLGLLAGTAGLLCSGVGPVMVAIVGMAVLLRRGWRAAAFHTVPLAAIYTTWYVLHRHEIEQQNIYYVGGPYGPAQAASFVWTGLSGSFRALGGSPVAGIALAAVLIVGLALAWLPLRWSTFRRQAGAPAALLVGAVVFLALAGHERSAFGSAHALESRYLYLVVAFVLPAFAVAVQALTRAWRWAAVPAVGLLLVGVPYNVRQFDRAPDNVWSAGVLEQRDLMTTAPRSPLAERVPPWVLPDRDLRPTMTIGWMLEQLHDGNLPEPTGDTSALEAQLPVRLGVGQLSTAQLAMSTANACGDVPATTKVTPAVGDVFRSDGPIDVWLLDADDQAVAAPITFAPTRAGTAIEILLPDLHLKVRGASKLCR